MAVLIVNPDNGISKSPQLPMGPLYLATALDRSGYDVKVLDYSVDDVKASLEKHMGNADAVGFSVMTAQVKDALRLSDMIKARDPSLPVIWGGVHPTLFPVQTVSDGSVDYVISEEGEKSIVQLAGYIQGKGGPGKIRGLVYKEGGKVRMNAVPPFIDLNEYSPPSWHLMKMERYIQHYVLGGDDFGRSLPVHSGRGCVYRCTFCINTGRRKWRPLSAENMMAEVRALTSKYDLDYIKFVDENFFIDRKRVADFSRLMAGKNLGVGWHAGGRANYFNEEHINDELLDLMVKSGFRTFSMGVESGSQRILDMIKKEIKVEDVIRAVKKCEEKGIKTVCSFMIGLPGEGQDDMLRTLHLIKEIKRISPRASIIGPQVFRPYPGAELYAYTKKLGFKEPATLRGWCNVDLEGYTSARDLPWVKDPEFIDSISFYLSRSQFRPGGLARTMAERLFFKPLADFRIRYNIFGFPFEKKMFEFVKMKKAEMSRYDE
jgi:radical SAM superfamily enzyme YgiQ (UPF0313 family)